MTDISLKVCELDGKKVAYCSETIFYIQTGKNKGSYKTKYSIKGNLAQAVMYYNAINIGPSFKKRLTMNGEVLSRQIYTS